MSTQQQQEEPAEIEEVAAKTIVLNTYDLAGEDITRKEAWEALTEASVLDTGYEYFRRTYKEAVEGKHDVESAIDGQIKSVLEPVLFQAGLLDETVEDETEETEEEPINESRLTASASLTPETTESVTVQDLRALRERIDLLRRQAEFEAGGGEKSEYRKAQFIAQEALKGLDELIEETG